MSLKKKFLCLAAYMTEEEEIEKWSETPSEEEEKDSVSECSFTLDGGKWITAERYKELSKCSITFPIRLKVVDASQGNALLILMLPSYQCQC